MNPPARSLKTQFNFHLVAFSRIYVHTVLYSLYKNALYTVGQPIADSALCRAKQGREFKKASITKSSIWPPLLLIRQTSWWTGYTILTWYTVEISPRYSSSTLYFPALCDSVLRLDKTFLVRQKVKKVALPVYKVWTFSINSSYCRVWVTKKVASALPCPVLLVRGV